MSRKKAQDHSICRNRRATHRFEILERIECGIALQGAEVKSLREGAVSLEEAYARIERDEVWLIGCHIAPYTHGRTRLHESLRRRKLLLHARQIRKLKPMLDQRGLTLVPLRLYFNDRGIAKIVLALAQGKKVADKRQALKQREHQREMERATRRRR